MTERRVGRGRREPQSNRDRKGKEDTEPTEKRPHGLSKKRDGGGLNSWE